MKKHFFFFLIIAFSFVKSLAIENPKHIESSSSTELNADEAFCENGWLILDLYWESGGTDGFYAGQLFCEQCGC